ncbi:flagellar hook-length control protein FliK [Aeromonas finlandensis]|uniref:flagellar hook-length control protein FliK n=1 Tax=Aeromonas finlandensis TaxID=1543375 RepID=UPI00051C9419|nr:flagellar hook-length control protein FliK [Aeromonas finlandensis]
MGLIQFSGVDGLHTADVGARNRLTGKAGGEGELYQPLDEVVEPLVAVPLPALPADSAELDEDGESQLVESDVTEQLQAFTNMFPLFARGEGMESQGFRVNNGHPWTESDISGQQVAADSKLSLSLRVFMGATTPLAGPEVMSPREVTFSASEQAFAMVLANASGQAGALPGRFSLPAAGSGLEVGNVALDSAVAENKLPDGRQLAVGSLSPQLNRPVDYQWAPVRLSDNQTQWGEQLVSLLRDKVELQVNQQVKQAHIRLDPPELGRLELTVKLDGDRLNVQLNVTNPAVRDALIQSMERLRMSLAPHHAGGVEVNVGQGSEQGQQERWQQEKILAGRRQWQDESDPAWDSVHDWLNTLV